MNENNNDNDVPGLAPEAPPAVERALTIIGFTNPAERARIRAEGFSELEDLRSLTAKDIRRMDESFSRRTAAQGRIMFGLAKTKKLIGFMQWVQDAYRCNEAPDIETFTLESIVEAAQRDIVRQAWMANWEPLFKNALPEKLKDEKTWPTFYDSLLNALTIVPGVNGVPIVYLLRELVNPHPYEEYTDYNAKAIACAPLSGPFFEADTRQLHQIIQTLVQGESAEAWIKRLAKFQCGRRDVQALVKHYAGEGNSTRRIADAERLKDGLHYSNEKSLPFSSFLDRLQRMFTIFDEEKEEMTENAKVRFLLKKTQNASLHPTVAALTIEHNMKGLTFVSAANHLASAVAALPEYQLSRTIARIRQESGRGGGGRGSGGRGTNDFDESGSGKDDYDSGEAIHTGYYSKEEWDILSSEERKSVYQARDKERLSGDDNQDLDKEEEEPPAENKAREKKGSKRDRATMGDDELQRIVKAVCTVMASEV
jgi:hypothetical protein